METGDLMCNLITEFWRKLKFFGPSSLSPQQNFDTITLKNNETLSF